VYVLVVEDRPPQCPPVLGLPEPSGGCPGVIHERIARDAGNGRHSVPDDPDVPERESPELFGRNRLSERGCRRDESDNGE
jgi:hypothetical protein